MLDWVLNMPLNLCVVIGVRNVVSKAICVQSKLVINILMRKSVYSDRISLFEAKSSSFVTE